MAAGLGWEGSTSNAGPSRFVSLIGLTGQFAAVDEALTGYENLLLVARLLELPGRQAQAACDGAAGAFRLG